MESEKDNSNQYENLLMKLAGNNMQALSTLVSISPPEEAERIDYLTALRDLKIFGEDIVKLYKACGGDADDENYNDMRGVLLAYKVLKEPTANAYCDDDLSSIVRRVLKIHSEPLSAELVGAKIRELIDPDRNPQPSGPSL
jgi:hypothetical protein